MDNEKGDLCSTDMQTGTCGNLWMISLGIYLWAECPRVGVCVCVCVFEWGRVRGWGTHTEVLDVYRACRRERESGWNNIQDYSTSLADVSISSLFWRPIATSSRSRSLNNFKWTLILPLVFSILLIKALIKKKIHVPSMERVTWKFTIPYVK